MKTKYLFSTLFLLLSFLLNTSAQQNTLTVPDVTVRQGGTIDLPVNLDNTADIVAVQFTLTAADGITINTSSAALTERSDGHSAVMQQTGVNKYMVMIFSSANKYIIGRTGKLLSVPMSVSQSIEEGTELPLTLSDVVISGKDGTNLATGFSAGKVTIAKSPDLEASNVTLSTDKVSPGSKLTVSWLVANIGGLPTNSGWNEQVYLDAEDGTSKLLGTLYYENNMNAGGTVSRSAELDIPQILGLSGETKVRVKVSPNSTTGEPSWLQGNNEALSENNITVDKLLFLSPDSMNIDESSASPVRMQLSRSGSTANEEAFTVAAAADSRVQLPATVTIPAGQSGTYFYATITANGTLDSGSAVSLTVSGNDYPEISGSMTIEDDTYPSLSITTEVQEVTEGNSIELTISAERASQSGIEVKLISDPTSAFTIPSITIPAGETTVSVTVPSVNDDIPNIEQAVKFTVSAAGYNPASVFTTLLDDDMPTLALILTPTAVSETAGPLALTATLSRTSNIDKNVTVKLSDDSNGSIYYSTKTIEMAAGVSTATFNLGPVDNALVDGERTYNVSAAVYIASCSCNASEGTSGGVVSVPVTVYDNDGPVISMTAASSVLKEGGEITVSVNRNTDTTNEMTVSLSSDHDDDIVYPATVTIPAGETAVSFTVRSNLNEISGDGFTAVLTAEADGYSKGNIWFTVSDQTLPDAQITKLGLSESEAVAGDSITVSVSLANTGTYYLPEMTKIGIYVSNSSEPAATVYLQDSLAAGTEMMFNRDISLPATIGTYSIYAVANDGRNVKELSYNNNSSSTVQVKTVSPFSVSVQTDKQVYKPGEKVTISGTVEGRNVAEQAVEVYAINGGYRHTIEVITDATGAFSTTYEPYSGQTGHFDIGACYPGEGLRTAIASFNIYGVKRNSNSAITCEALMGETYSNSFEISNTGDISLTGVKVNVVSKPENCDIQLSCPETLTGGQTAVVSFTITPTALSSGTDWELITLNVTSNEGAKLSTTLYYYCKNAQGQLKASLSTINTTMIKGSSRDYPFIITNVGKGETGKVTVALPSWMKSVTPTEIASMANGDSTTVILRFTPTEDMQLNVPVTGNIGINCANGTGLSLPFYIEPVSTSTGTLVIDVCDEYTYYTAEKPHLEGASVTVKHPTTGELVASGKTGSDGLFSAVLPEGYYAVQVSAANHNTYSNNILVDPGVETTKVVNLSIEAITLKWNVVETEVEDEYEIVTTVNYETNVPVPVVELSVPNSIEADQLSDGESLIFYATLTNRGLITAEDVELIMPEESGGIIFEALNYTGSFDLAPQSSVQFPVKVTHKEVSSGKAKGVGEIIVEALCTMETKTLYFWDCGKDRKWHEYGVQIKVRSCEIPNMPSLINIDKGRYGGGTIVVGPTTRPGGGIPGGSVGPYTPSSDSGDLFVTEDLGCLPCQNGIVLATARCAGQFVGDAVETLQALLGVEFDENEEVSEIEVDFDSLDGIINTVEQIASAFDKCVTGQQSVDKVLDCYQVASKVVDDIFDETFDKILDNEDLLTPSQLKKIKRLKTIGKKMLKWKRWVDIGADCAQKFLHACDHLNDSTPSGAKSFSAVSTQTNNDAYISVFLDNMGHVADGLSSFGRINDFFWGSENEWDEISHEEMSALIDSVDYGTMAFEDVLKYKPEAVSTETFRKFYQRRVRIINNELYPEEQDSLFSAINDLHSSEEYFRSLSYSSAGDFLNKEFETAWNNITEASNSVCSSITLQFSQKMVMTRQAFRGTLTVYNGNETESMTDVKLSLVVTDEDGNVATSHEFQINPESLDGFDGELSLNGGWTLDASETGTATIMFIPTKYAAPTTPKAYSFGGSLSYVDPFTGLEVTRDLTPITLTVNPSPNLDLTYFMQRDIIGDDPLTEAVEPMEEAEFSLLINNTGYGDATDVRMTTDQPKIVDNEKGLAIDFELISSQLNGGDKTLALGGSVATEFGNIPAKSSAYAQWWITSTLLGHFTEYSVEATHLSSYGNPDLSLLNDVTIHELIRSLEISDGDEKIAGFLTNDIVDVDDTPDMLYLSDGEIESVAKTAGSQITKNSSTEYALTITPAAEGWNYGNTADPTYGVSKLKSVVRQSDGKEISLRNFWQTAVTLRDGKDPLYENRIHFTDDFQTTTAETYILTFEEYPSVELEVAAIEGVPTGVADSHVDTVNVMFNKVIDPATFTADDITLNVQGVRQNASLIELSTDDNKTFTLDLTELNKQAGNGYYVLTVQTAEITDWEGYTGSTGKSAGWTMYENGHISYTQSVYPEGAGTVTVATSDGQLAEDRVTYGSSITLSAKSGEGYNFSNWTINGEMVSEDSVFSYTAVGDVNVVANYSAKTYTVIVESQGVNGSITNASSGIYSHGAQLTLIVVPDEDFMLDKWYVNGSEVEGSDTLAITVTGETSISAAFARSIYHQQIGLEIGWNWISSYLTEGLPFDDFATVSTAMRGQEGENVYDPDAGWTGSLNSLAAGKTYKIESNSNITKTVSGHLYDAVNTPITLTAGWNWIAYPYYESRTLASVIGNAENGDFITSQTGFSEYSGGNWLGTLDVLVPGNGYLYKSVSDKSLNFDFLSANAPETGETPAEGETSGEYEIDIRKYPNTMCITASAFVHGNAVAGSDYVVYAMSGSECRGTSQFVDGMYLITVYGDGAEDISFVIENTTTGDSYICTETVEFRSDVMGSRNTAYEITAREGTTGIDGIVANGHKMHVYTVPGILVSKEATMRTLQRLPEGVYIIDGRKYIVK